jgi:P-type Cu+ transporter
MFVAIDGSPPGSSRRRSDQADDAGGAAALRARACAIVMLTGDNRTTAEAVAASSASTRSWPRCCPRRRQAIVAELRREAGVVAMAGDGINDAPALAPPTSASRWAPAPTWRWRAPASRWSRATCAGIVRARRLSRATMRNIRQNLFFAFVYNALGVPIAAGVLYPWFGILLSRSSPARRWPSARSA